MSNMSSKQLSDAKQEYDVESMLTRVCDEAFKDEKDSYKNLKDKINNVDIQTLLGDSVDDLSGKFGLNQTEEETLKNMRVDLRLIVFKTKGSMNLEEDYDIKTFQWDQVCQLLEQYVRPKSKLERRTWYNYIEEHTISAQTLVKKYKEIMKVLNLNMSQKENFKELIEKLGGDTDEKKGGNNITLRDKVVAGAVVNGENADVKEIKFAAHGGTFNEGPKEWRQT